MQNKAGTPHRYGRTANTQQGPAPENKNRSAGAYSRSSQRAGASATTFTDMTKADRDARNKKHKSGRHSKQRLFP